MSLRDDWLARIVSNNAFYCLCRYTCYYEHQCIGVGYLLDEVDGLSRRSHFLWCKNLLHRHESFYIRMCQS